MKTRYLVFTEYDPDQDFETIIKEDAAFQVERAEHPEKYPRYATTTSTLGADLPKLTERIQAVDVLEADSPEQMMNLRAHAGAEMTVTKSFRKWYIPLQDYSDAFAAELAQQRKLMVERKE